MSQVLQLLTLLSLFIVHSCNGKTDYETTKDYYGVGRECSDICDTSLESILDCTCESKTEGSDLIEDCTDRSNNTVTCTCRPGFKINNERQDIACDGRCHRRPLSTSALLVKSSENNYFSSNASIYRLFSYQIYIVVAWSIQHPIWACNHVRIPSKASVRPIEVLIMIFILSFWSIQNQSLSIT